MKDEKNVNQTATAASSEILAIFEIAQMGHKNWPLFGRR